jgi:2,4-dienoyl-CoA reductase-like NADH-dependent reductase (Old Yellow Enzyme family)
MKAIDSYDDHGEEEVFEAPTNMDTDDIRDMVVGYVKAADRMKLIEILATCRDLFFER